MVRAGGKAEFAEFSGLLLFCRHYDERRTTRPRKQIASRKQSANGHQTQSFFCPSLRSAGSLLRNAARESRRSSHPGPQRSAIGSWQSSLSAEHGQHFAANAASHGCYFLSSMEKIWPSPSLPEFSIRTRC